MKQLAVVFPSVPKLPDRSSYPQYRTHVAWAQMLIDAAARGLRQASARQPRAKTPPSHLIAVLTDCLCKSLGSLEELLAEFCDHQAAF